MECWCGLPPSPNAKRLDESLVCPVCVKQFKDTWNEYERIDPLDGHAFQPSVGSWLRRFFNGLRSFLR